MDVKDREWGAAEKNLLFVVERNLKVTDETFRLSAHSRWSQITRYLCPFQIFLVDLNSLKLLAICNPLSVWRDCLLRCTFCTILTKKVRFRFKSCSCVFSCIPGWLLWRFNWIQSVHYIQEQQKASTPSSKMVHSSSPPGKKNQTVGSPSSPSAFSTRVILNRLVQIIWTTVTNDEGKDKYLKTEHIKTQTICGKRERVERFKIHFTGWSLQEECKTKGNEVAWNRTDRTGNLKNDSLPRWCEVSGDNLHASPQLARLVMKLWYYDDVHQMYDNYHDGWAWLFGVKRGHERNVKEMWK